MANSRPVECGMSKDALKGLYRYGAEIDTAKDLIESAIKKKITDCKCTVAILAILAGIAAGGGATLIATSGGPTAHALSFYGGVMLTTVSAGMVIWMVIIIAKAYRFKKREDERFTTLSTDLVGNQGILDGMRDREVNREKIQAVINKMRAAHFAQFVTLATQTILPEDREEALSTQEQAILSSIAERVEVGEDRAPLIPLDQQSLILENILQEETNAAVGRMGQDLFNAHVQAAIDSEYPQTLSAIAQDNKLLQADVRVQRLAMQKMTAEQANAFVAKMGAEQYQALAGNVLTAYYGEEAAPANQTVLNALATSAHTSSLTPQQQRILMEHIEADLQVAIINRLDEGQFDAFARHINDTYFAAEVASEPNLEVLRAMLSSNKVERLLDQQLYEMINAMSQHSANAAISLISTARYAALVEYTITNHPDNRKMRTALAQRPVDFARLVANEALSIEAISEIAALMDYAQKADFIRVLTQRALEIKESLENRNEYEKIVEVVWKTYKGTLTLEFADLFSGEVVDPNAQALVQQLAQWPAITAQAIWFGPKSILEKAGLINALWNAMGEDGKRLAVSMMVDFYFRLEYSSDAARTVELAKRLLGIEHWYIYNGIEMPELLKRAFDDVYSNLAQRNQNLSYTQFKRLVIDNKEISEESQDRYIFTLALLERMDQATKLIKHINLHHYKDMFKILIIETMSSPGQSVEEKAAHISDSRKKLYHLFNSSKQKTKILSKLEDQFKDKEDKVVMSTFNLIANMGKD